MGQNSPSAQPDETAAFSGDRVLSHSVSQRPFSLACDVEKAGRLDEAEHLFRAVLKVLPDHADSVYRLGALALKRGRGAEAIEHLRRAVALAPNNAVFHAGLAAGLARRSRRKEAETVYRRSIDIDPGNVRTLCELGYLRLEHGDNAEAVHLFDRALTLSPRSIRAHCGRARARRFRRGDSEIQVLETLLRNARPATSARPALLAALGKAFDDVGDYRKAFSYYSRMNEESARARKFDIAGYRRFMALVGRAHGDRPSSDHEFVAAMSSEPGPIFVVGMTRSGKSLVEQILARHPDVAAMGESAELQFAIERVRQRHGLARPFPLCFPDLDNAKFREIGSFYLDAVAPAADGARYTVNTHPGNQILIGLIMAALPDSRVIYCVRDPLDTCLFAYFKHYAEGNEYAADLGTLGAYCVELNKLRDRWIEFCGKRILVVRYENLIRRPDEVANEIYEYSGLESPEEELKVALTPAEIGHAVHYILFLCG